MSEKRILCIEASEICLDLRFGSDINGKGVLYCALDTSKDWKDITEKDCKNCKKARYLGITREQAIDKMAKAIFKSRWSKLLFEENALRADQSVIFAEAALNALLEDNNGN